MLHNVIEHQWAETNYVRVTQWEKYISSSEKRIGKKCVCANFPRNYRTVHPFRRRRKTKATIWLCCRSRLGYAVSAVAYNCFACSTIKPSSGQNIEARSHTYTLWNAARHLLRARSIFSPFSSHIRTTETAVWFRVIGRELCQNKHNKTISECLSITFKWIRARFKLVAGARV